MPRVVHFEISVDNVEEAVNFYKNVFNWQIEKWPGPVDYWLVGTGSDEEPGIDGAIQKRQNKEQTVNTIDVDDLDAFIQKVEEHGGKVVTPRMAVQGVGYMAYCTDLEGNLFGMMQSDPTAQ